MGLWQGCVMSLWLFNVYMDGALWEMNARVQGKGWALVSENEREWKISQLLFAHDTALVAECEEALQKLVTEFGSV